VAIAEFERDLVRERILAGLRRARARGRHLGLPRVRVVDTVRAPLARCPCAGPRVSSASIRAQSRRAVPRAALCPPAESA
jgi:DNA invertase Pin-like site-specific DNA recombinase